MKEIKLILISSMIILSLNLSAQIKVSGSGDVGIGISTPSSKFEIYGDSKNIEISNTSENVLNQVGLEDNLS